VDLHASVALDQVAQDAFVGGVQVLNQDNGHPAFGGGGHVGEELLKGL